MAEDTPIHLPKCSSNTSLCSVKYFHYQRKMKSFIEKDQPKLLRQHLHLKKKKIYYYIFVLYYIVH